jgi:hypothetical protein
VSHFDDDTHRKSQTIDEVVTVIRAVLKGEPTEPDRIANALKEIRQKVGDLVLNQNPAGGVYLNASKWWEEVLKRTQIDPLEEAQGVVRNLLHDPPIEGEPLRQRLHQVSSLLDQAQEQKEKE